MKCVAGFVLHPHSFLSVSRAYYGNVNFFFGGPSSTAVKASAKLKQLEEENEDAMFVFVSDVWLDSVEVLEQIQTMFSGPVTLQIRFSFFYTINFSVQIFAGIFFYDRE